jgi:hypothetical protein
VSRQAFFTVLIKYLTAHSAEVYNDNPRDFLNFVNEGITGTDQPRLRHGTSRTLWQLVRKMAIASSSSLTQGTGKFLFIVKKKMPSSSSNCLTARSWVFLAQPLPAPRRSTSS